MTIWLLYLVLVTAATYGLLLVPVTGAGDSPRGEYA